MIFCMTWLTQVPYGVLVFVPSYFLAEKLFERWSQTDVIDSIAFHKSIFVEARSASKEDFAKMMTQFNACIDLAKGSYHYDL